jgi:hypothetical protein
MEQWRCDIQRLLGAARQHQAAQSSHRQERSQRQQKTEGSQAHPQRSVQRDLRHDLDELRKDEDARVYMERQRERQRNIEGRQPPPCLPPPYKEVGLNQTLGGGCAALAPHLRSVAWPAKFRPHLPEKYDGSINPAEFLQIYSTAIHAAGGNEAVMANYFHVALTGSARSWLMNLRESSIQSWADLCYHFRANFESSYKRPGTEADLHTIVQGPAEQLRSFVQRFSQVRNSIPNISDQAILHAFRHGVRDEKMLEKIATHDVTDASALFALADKCSKAAEGRAWHSSAEAAASKKSAPAPAPAGDPSKKKKKKKKSGGANPMTGAPTAAAAADKDQRPKKRPRQPPGSGEKGTWCPVHQTDRHSAEECREVQKLAERYRNKQSRRDDGEQQQDKGKGVVQDPQEEEEPHYQEPKRTVNAFQGNDDSDASSGGERRKTMATLYGGSWSLSSRRILKVMRRDVASEAPMPRTAPHIKWMNQSITFGPSDCPPNMAGAGILPLLTSPTISNVRLCNALIDGGAELNLINLPAFEQMQISFSKLLPSRPFGGVGKDPVWSYGSITLPVTFGTEDRFRTEYVTFDVASIDLPFNAIIGRPALYQFMAVAHYGYLALKMPVKGGVLSVKGDRKAGMAALEKLYELALAREGRQHGNKEEAVPSIAAPGSSKLKTTMPRIKVASEKAKATQPETKTVQISTDPPQFTRVSADLGEK